MTRLCDAVRVVSAYHLRQETCPAAVLDVPGQVSHVWSWFWRLDQRRAHGEAVQPVSYSEVESWARMSGVHLRRWELEALTDMDLARRSALRPPDEGKSGELRRSVSFSDSAAVMDMFDRFRRSDV